MVKSVDRALRIITMVSTRKEGMGVTELAAFLDLNKSTIFRLLATLAEHGFIEQDQETKKYRLGYKYLELSSMLLESIDLRTQAKPFLKELESHTNEVIHLVVYDQGEVVYIEKLEGNETLRTHSQVGRRAPIHCTSVGKVILAYLPDEEILNIIEKHGLPKHTEQTISDKEAFLEELNRIKEQGYGTEFEENEPGITCIAAPIFDNSKKITAAISISGPSIRMTDERLAELKTVLIDIGNKISKRLGYTEN
ncbi:IclR family transcriptional regulator [Metabacillus fastidiosus]|uniref:IclR family transcriptional regulator n=1 Tax=Metabacillus fastidiosus TaxID=1458 RepID=A0ABU6P3N9_9BACI|nr:IclR family transcriptional regulator [Metabacillus fastidiosus]MED4403533.1 IclR family transcriptional regulator [Metabacillus fastidiosus]MED4463741.1 IclR family transcriptional regulator [Metabacillus fastidiosus]MED4533111.1 IclR family transcriptional regulator [Metabacillus fastidiosus]